MALHRIPKTGSENLAYLIKHLSERNNFKHKRYSRKGRGSLRPEQVKRMERRLCDSRNPTLTDGHIHFLPLPRCGKTISWITMVCKFVFQNYQFNLTQVRDPVEMFISRYFYARRSVVVQMEINNVLFDPFVKILQSFLPCSSNFL